MSKKIPVSNLTINREVLFKVMVKSRKEKDEKGFLKDLDLLISSVWYAGQMQGALETVQYAGMTKKVENPLDLLGVLDYITEKNELQMDDPNEWKEFVEGLDEQKTTSNKVD